METQTYNYKVVRQFAIMTVVWGIVGMLVGVIIAAQLVWPELNLGFLHFGRLRPLHTNAVIFAMAIFKSADQSRKLRITPQSRPQPNCILPIIALAVPARAPCSDIAIAMAFGPVKPIAATARNIPAQTIYKGACFMLPATRYQQQPHTSQQQKTA